MIFKFIQILFLSVFLVTAIGCNTQDMNISNSNKKDITTVCIDGVEYIKQSNSYGIYLGYGYMSVKFTKYGTVSLCDDNKVIYE